MISNRPVEFITEERQITSLVCYYGSVRTDRKTSLPSMQNYFPRPQNCAETRHRGETLPSSPLCPRGHKGDKTSPSAHSIAVWRKHSWEHRDRAGGSCSLWHSSSQPGTFGQAEQAHRSCLPPGQRELAGLLAGDTACWTVQQSTSCKAFRNASPGLENRLRGLQARDHLSVLYLARECGGLTFSLSYWALLP